MVLGESYLQVIKLLFEGQSRKHHCIQYLRKVFSPVYSKFSLANLKKKGGVRTPEGKCFATFPRRRRWKLNKNPQKQEVVDKMDSSISDKQSCTRGKLFLNCTAFKQTTELFMSKYFNLNSINKDLKFAYI